MSEMRQSMWTAMRIMRRFQTRDVVAITGVQLETGRRYLNVLKKTGHIKQVGKIEGIPVYALVRDTGPQAPRVSKWRWVTDPNTGEHWDIDRLRNYTRRSK